MTHNAVIHIHSNYDAHEYSDIMFIISYSYKLNLVLSSLRIYHIGVHKLYYETCALFSSTKSRIYDKEKHKQVKVIIFYKSAMDSNTFLFDPIVPKIGHIRVGQAQVASTHVQVLAQ